MKSEDWALWITAAATAITAVLTGTGGWAAWVALARERRRDDPILERSYRWIGNGCLKLDLTVRNRLPEVVTVDSIEVLAPKNTTITEKRGQRSSVGEPGPPLRGERSKAPLNYRISPIGFQRSAVSSGDSGYFEIYLWPEDPSFSGKVKVAFRISSKADTIRNKRIVVTNIVAAPKSMKSD